MATVNLKHLSIFLADDDVDDCHFFKEALEQLLLSTRLTTTPNGENLMNLLIQDTEELPDVLFLDLNMPRKNGFECLSEIKLHQKLKQLPVIIFSTSFEQGVVNRLYQNGAQYFIRKPSEFSQYKKIILKVLTLIAQGKDSQPTKDDFVITLQTD